MIFLRHKDRVVENFAVFSETASQNKEENQQIRFFENVEFDRLLKANPNAKVIEIEKDKNIFKVPVYIEGKVAFYNNFVIFSSKNKKYMLFDKATQE